MKYLYFFSALALLAFISFEGHGEVVPNDKSYSSLKVQNYRYIYSEDHAAFIPLVLFWNEEFQKEYERSFEWSFNQEAALVLASGRNQIANGFATVIPHLKTVFYPSGILLRDEFAISSWFKVLLIHETAHLYQLHVKDELPTYLSHLIGNPLLFPTPFAVPIFIHPNVLLPSFFLEGNAVMNESRWGIGGRLYSGEIKALTYNMALNEDLTAERLFNEHLFFPFGSEKYYLGGYFAQFLGEKYGVDRANLFFKMHAEKFINPLLVNDTFLRTFGSSYNQLFREYDRDLELKAQGQRSLQSPPLAHALFHAPLNHDEDEIFFLVQKKGTSYPELWQIPKLKEQENASVEPKTQEIDLILGKVFKTDRGYATASSYQKQPNLIEYGLYLKDLKAHPDFANRIVSDFRGDKLLSFDPTQSFVHGQLFLDKEFYSRADSEALLGPDGSVYYFQQTENTRTLLKNKEPLTSYQGYYGKLMEIDNEGRVYFVATTEKGSGLYRWSKDIGFEEVLASDQVMDARLIDSNRVLAVEIGHNGYSYKVANLEPKKTPPFFEHNPLEAPKEKQIQDSQTISLPELSVEPRKYRALRELRYDNADVYYTSSEEDGLMGGVALNFSDPLSWNQLQLSYHRDTYLRDRAYISYLNQRHQLNYLLAYIYDEDAYIYIRANELSRRKLANNTALLQLNYPLFIHGRWSSQWNGSLRWEKESIPLKAADDYFDLKNSLKLQWAINYPLAFDSYRSFNITLAHRLRTEREPFKKTDDIYQAAVQFTYDLGKQTYFSANYQAGLSERNNIKLDNSFSSQPFSEEYLSMAVNHEYRLDRVQIVELGLKKAFNSPLYFARWPLSLRRWAPFLKARHYDIKGNNNLVPAFWEYEFGSEFEFLIAHRFPARSLFSAHFADPEPFDLWRRPASPAGSGWRLTIGTDF